MLIYNKQISGFLKNLKIKIYTTLIKWRYAHVFKMFPFKFVIAGGTLTNFFIRRKILPSSDIDIFFTNIDELNKAKDYFKYYGYDESNVFNYQTFKHNVVYQFIFFKLFDDPVDLIMNFDFTVCSVAFDGEKLYMHDNFLSDLKAKRIKYINITNAKSKLYRLHKYKIKGFLVSKELLISLLNDVHYDSDPLGVRYNEGIRYDVCKIMDDLGLRVSCNLKRK